MDSVDLDGFLERRGGRGREGLFGRAVEENGTATETNRELGGATV